MPWVTDETARSACGDAEVDRLREHPLGVLVRSRRRVSFGHRPTLAPDDSSSSFRTVVHRSDTATARGTRHGRRRPDPDQRRRPPGRAAGHVRGPTSPAQYRDQAPEGRPHRRRLRRLDVQRRRSSRTSGSTRSPGGPRRSTASSRPRSTRCGPAATTSHERIKDMNAGGVLGSMCFPSFPGFCGRLFAAADDKDLALRRAAGLQRLAHRRVVRRLPGPLHPDGAARAVGRRAGRRRGAPGRGQGRALDHLHREPGDARLPELPRALLGPAVEGAVSTTTSCCRSTSARRASSRSPRPTRRST